MTTNRSILAICALVGGQIEFVAAAATSSSGADGKSGRPVDASAPSEPAPKKKKKPHPPTTAFDRAVDPTIIPTPPPAVPPEHVPPRPAVNHIWVPGHYVPVERKWTWVAGKWTVPPDPLAIWIPGRYEADTQRWTSGYWQPGDPTGSPPPQTPSGK